MPELPEVETIARDLRGLIVGKRIASFTSEWERLTEPEPPELVAQRLAGTTVTGVRRRGKLAVLDLDTGLSLVISLRMTGRLLFRAPGAPDDRFLRGRIRFDDGTELRFADTRKFGRMVLVLSDVVSEAARDGRRPGRPLQTSPRPGGRALPRRAAPLYERLGVEPLASAFTARVLAALLRARGRSRLKPLLLDQTVIAGIGNIYANEALFRARLHPLRRAGELRPEQLRALWRAIRATLRRAIRLRGSSIDDYVDARGERGRMHEEFLVHGREGEPCPRCGRAIRKSYVAGRGTYCCPNCQRQPPAPASPPSSRAARPHQSATGRARGSPGPRPNVR